MTHAEYQYKTEKSIINWESPVTTNMLLNAIAHHLADIADEMQKNGRTDTNHDK